MPLCNSFDRGTRHPPSILTHCKTQNPHWAAAALQPMLAHVPCHNALPLHPKMRQSLGLEVALVPSPVGVRTRHPPQVGHTLGRQHPQEGVRGPTQLSLLANKKQGCLLLAHTAPVLELLRRDVAGTGGLTCQKSAPARAFPEEEGDRKLRGLPGAGAGAGAAGGPAGVDKRPVEEASWVLLVNEGGEVGARLEVAAQGGLLEGPIVRRRRKPPGLHGASGA